MRNFLKKWAEKQKQNAELKEQNYKLERKEVRALQRKLSKP